MENQNKLLRTLQQRTRRLERWLVVSLCAWAVTVGIILSDSPIEKTGAQQSPTTKSMRLSELIIEDSTGRERVRVAGNLPDAIIGGKRVPRGQQAAGVLLYDGSGNERGGYVTFEPSGNVGLTLDSKTTQVASFVASSEGNASALSLWQGKGMIELRSDSEGSRLSAVKDNVVVVQHPNIETMSAEMCGAYKGALSRVSADQVSADCRRRFTSTACSKCLKRK
jgi:hypothetical protein